MFKLAVVGGRDFGDYCLLEEEIEVFRRDCLHKALIIVSGGAKGADTLAEKYSFQKSQYLKVFNADWCEYGKSAGYKRNIQIVNYCEGLIAFWNGISKGTKHSIDLAKKANKLIKIVYY